MSKKESAQPLRGIQNLNVIDLILIDHQYIKECIEVLATDGVNKRRRMTVAKSFLNAIATHSLVEKEAIYNPLKNNEELHFNILQANIEHEVVDQKVKSLKLKLFKARSLKEDVEAELKILGDLMKQHMSEEETEILPKMQREIDDATLNDFGKNYMKLRKFTARDFKNYPLVLDELIEWKDSIQKVSSEFLTKMDNFVENMEH